MQSHRVLTCACDCVAKNACLPLPGEIKPPQTTQYCRDDGKSSTAISRTDLTLRVRYFPRQPRTPVLPRRPPDSRSMSYPAGRTRWHFDGDGGTDNDGDDDGATDNDDDDNDDCDDCDGVAVADDDINNNDDDDDIDNHNRGMIVAMRRTRRRRGRSQILWQCTQQSNRSRGGGVVDGNE